MSKHSNETDIDIEIKILGVTRQATITVHWFREYPTGKVIILEAVDVNGDRFALDEAQEQAIAREVLDDIEGKSYASYIVAPFDI